MQRIIKKYPNRRLYDSEESRYITLTDIKTLVLRGVEFCVIDKKTGADITRVILLAVISELDHQDDTLLTVAFLEQVIKAFGSASAEALGDQLEQSLATGLALQNQQLGQI